MMRGNMDLIVEGKQRPIGFKHILASGDGVGFYGVLSPEDFISYGELSRRLEFSSGIGHNASGSWLLFSADQKPLYVSKRTVRYGVSYDDLEAANLVAGDRTVVIHGVEYRVRLLTYDEWIQLIWPIHADDVISWEWGINYTDDDLGIGSGDGRASWVEETAAGYPDRRFSCGNPAVESLVADPSSYSGSAFGWRVVLEPIGSMDTPDGTEVGEELLEVHRRLLAHHRKLEDMVQTPSRNATEFRVPETHSERVELLEECLKLKQQIVEKSLRLVESRYGLGDLHSFMREHGIK